jgi:hypothetical protein
MAMQCARENSDKAEISSIQKLKYDNSASLSIAVEVRERCFATDLEGVGNLKLAISSDKRALGLSRAV